MGEIKAGDILAWKVSLSTGKPKGEGLTQKTVSRKLSAIRNYFRWLESLEILEGNPTEGIFPGKPNIPLPVPLTQQEVDTLIVIAKDDPRSYLMLFLFLETGLKLEELMGLRTYHFDFTNQYVPTVTISENGEMKERIRTVKLPREMTDIYKAYEEKYKITDKLFPYTDRFIRKILAEIVAKAGIAKPVSAKILRDTYVMLHLRRGEDINILLERIGLDAEKSVDAKEKYLKMVGRVI